MKPTKPKSKSKEVRAFTCGACRRLKKTRERADKCCRCPCGANVSRQFYVRCEDCGRRNAIRAAKAAVKRARFILNAREARVARLLAGTTPRHPKDPQS